MRRVLMAIVCVFAAGCGSEEKPVRAAHGDALLVVAPGNAAEVNTLRVTGLDAGTPDGFAASASMDDMPAKSSLTFVRSAGAYVAQTRFAMAGTWRIRIASRHPADFTIVVK